MNEATAERRTGLRCLRFFVGESVKTAKPKPFLTLPAVSDCRDSEQSGGAVKHTQTPETHSTARRGHNAVAVPFPGGILADAAENQRNSQTQTFLNSPRRLGAPRQRVLRRGSRITQKPKKLTVSGNPSAHSKPLP